MNSGRLPATPDKRWSRAIIKASPEHVKVRVKIGKEIKDIGPIVDYLHELTGRCGGVASVRPRSRPVGGATVTPQHPRPSSMRRRRGKPACGVRRPAPRQENRMTSTERNKAIARRFYDQVLNRKLLNTIDALCAPTDKAA